MTLAPRLTRRVVAALALALLRAGPGDASEFQVNSYTTNDQTVPAVATADSGRFLVVWDGGSGLGIFGQLFESNGSLVGSEFQVNTTTTGDKTWPLVAALGGENFVVVWQRFSSDSIHLWDIFGQRVDSSGALLGTEFVVNTYTDYIQQSAALAANGAGGFFVAWMNDKPEGNDLVAQRFSSVGAPLGTEFLISAYTTSAGPAEPAVAGDAAGNFIVTWTSVNQTAGDILGQRFDSGGVTLGTEFQINSYTTDTQGNSAVTIHEAGNFTVVWHSIGQDGSVTGVFGQRFDSSGAPLGTEFQVNTYTTLGQHNQSIAAHTDGSFLVVWDSSGQDGDLLGVFARQFNSSGIPQGAEFRVNTYTPLNQHEAKVARATGRNFVVTWQSLNQDGSGNGIFARIGPRPCADPLDFATGHKDGVFGVDGLDGAQAVVLSPDGKCAYVAGFNEDKVAVFSRDAATGDLTFASPAVTNVHLDGAAGLATSPNGAHLYVAAENADKVSWYTRNATTCQLTLSSFVNDASLNGTRAIALSPDGECAYAAAVHASAVVAYDRNPATGALAFVEAEIDGNGGVNELAGASAVAVSADGKHLYVAAVGDSAVSAFSRNVSTCALTFVQHRKDGVGGVDGLAGARGIALSPDDQHVYVASQTDDALAVFQRNSTTGALTFVETEKDGVNGVDGLNGAVSVTVNPNGAFVYVTGAADNALTAFERSPGTGKVILVKTIIDGSPIDFGLAGAHGVATSPGGPHVYATGNVDDSVVWFLTCCGNAQLESGEDCDDGNLSNGDCCSQGCRFESQNVCCALETCQPGQGCAPPCGGTCALNGSSCVCQ